MEEKTSKQVHEASKILRETIEKYLGEKCIVMWGVIHEDSNTFATGITLSEALNPSEMADLILRLNARAYNML